MPSKYQEYRQMADTAERQLTSSYKSWTQFLRTAARLYKYPYNEQVMIHAQRPDATACAEYDFWNKKMGRFVRRGSTGIALIDTSGQKPQLRYVFDVADTGEREHSRPIHLWQFRAEHEATVAATLERSYDVSGGDGIIEQMETAAAQLAREYWANHKRDILDNIDDSYIYRKSLKLPKKVRRHTNEQIEWYVCGDGTPLLYSGRFTSNSRCKPSDSIRSSEKE